MDSFELKNEFDDEFKEFEKAFTFKEEKEKKDLFELFSENKTFLYSVIFYAAGLFCGSYVYLKCKNDLLNSLFAVQTEDFLQSFLNNLSLYMLIFAISVLLGVCLVGFPLLNMIPLFVGFEAGMRVAYYYINYAIKGVGYSFLMVAPFVCLYLTVLIYSISMSYEMSRKIYDITVKKSEIEDFDYKTYLKKYLLYAALIVAVSLVNTAVSSVLSGIISI
ncbi:MAG: stage II sporulation protein M [Eubacterium sp.]|nr:stage II sporulation protein M [Eubacterium sp.]